jgi:hypothetical protein
MRLVNRRALAGRVAVAAALAVPLLTLVPHLALAGNQSAAKPASAQPGAGTPAQVGAQPSTSGVPSPTAGGQVFYVDSVHGNDSNTGLSPAQAWQSLSKVAAAKLQPGDVVAFARGDTFTGSATIDSGGTASAPVTFAAYGTGAAPVLTNPGQWNVKNPDGDVLSQVRHGPGADYTQYNVSFNSADNGSVVVFAGYWGPGPAAWEQIDDAALLGPQP